MHVRALLAREVFVNVGKGLRVGRSIIVAQRLHVDGRHQKGSSRLFASAVKTHRSIQIACTLDEKDFLVCLHDRNGFFFQLVLRHISRRIYGLLADQGIDLRGKSAEKLRKGLSAVSTEVTCIKKGLFAIRDLYHIAVKRGMIAKVRSEGDLADRKRLFAAHKRHFSGILLADNTSVLQEGKGHLSHIDRLGGKRGAKEPAVILVKVRNDDCRIRFLANVFLCYRRGFGRGDRRSALQ